MSILYLAIFPGTPPAIMEKCHENSSLTKISPHAEEPQLVGLGDHCGLPVGRFDGVFLWILSGHSHFVDPDGRL